jgi:hypothetical protein
MARGNSGRIVLEVDPKLKRRFYNALDRNGLTLKKWFLDNVDRYIEDSDQLKLFDTNALNVTKNQ